MSGVILAILEHPGSAPQTLAGARVLAGLMGTARINALAIRLPPGAEDAHANELMAAHPQPDADAAEQARLAALRRIFDAWAAATRADGVGAEWAEAAGSVDVRVAEWGRRSDFIVVNRPTRREGAPERLMLQSALFDTDRPVLVLPPGPARPFGERVAIAWRDDKRTIRAVLAALRLLSGAREVHLLAGRRAGAPTPGLPVILAEHGIAATLHVLRSTSVRSPRRCWPRRTPSVRTSW